MKRSLRINPLITLFLAQKLCVNSEKNVSTRRCGDTHNFCIGNRMIRELMHRDLFINTPSQSFYSFYRLSLITGIPRLTGDPTNEFFG